MISLPKNAQVIIDTLKTAGFEAYAVGGSVRDTIMGRPTKGWDFTTNAIPEEILALFPDSFYDNQFGTVGIKIKEKDKRQTEKEEDKDETVDIYEVTTYRNENGYTDRRHPDTITWGKTIEEDLARRDFTINTIAWDGKTLIDPYDGQKDIEAKIIRAVRDPKKRFAEDALRMMRAVRLAAELGFSIEEKTFTGIQANANLLSNVSSERIRDELLRILAAQFASDAILVLKATGLLTLILPEFEDAFTTEQKSPKRHHIYDVGTHSVMALKFCPSADPIIRLATLLHDIGKPKTFHKDDTGLITFYNHEVAGTRIVRNIVQRLRLSHKQADIVLTLVRWHQFSVDERQTDAALRRFIRRVGKENLDAILALRIGDRLGGGARETSWRLELYKKRLVEVQKQPFTVHDLLVDGNDIMAELGVKPGPIIGKILDMLFADVEAGTLLNEREALLKKMRELKSTEENMGKDWIPGQARDDKTKKVREYTGGSGERTGDKSM
ncbi:HD domain-containing protein [Candidatus Gottesmanbacteria bacterium]|nr:HD domain-containing protein [Candidatus Gottesmanbacteria bacterium]